jgi:drug/metabolite transporter (DMT)-like permease
VQGIVPLLLCALCWGPSYLFIKIAVSEIPPVTLVFIRVVIGALILYFFCAVQKIKMRSLKHLWKHLFVMGITLNVIPFLLISYGELYIPSSLAGILNGLTLIFTALFTHLFGRKEPLCKNKILGILTGLLGLVIIYLPLILQQKIEKEIGALFIVLAALSYGGGTVYARSHLQKIPGLPALTGQLFCAALLLLPLSLIIDCPFNHPVPNSPALLAALSLGIVATAGGFFFYYRAIQLKGAIYASLSVLLVPILAMILGAVFLKETLTWNLYLGAFCILLGIFMNLFSKDRSGSNSPA